MIRQVLPPSVEQIEAARRVIADHLVPTPTITLSLRGRPVFVKMESFNRPAPSRCAARWPPSTLLVETTQRRRYHCVGR